MAEGRTRTRLSPEARKDQLLDTAKQMIVSDGLQMFTMESLARTAEVSGPLVYNYFSSRQDLLGTLLEREYQAYVEKLTAKVSTAETFEDVVRVFVGSNFDHHAPGNILPILQSQPEIASMNRSVREQHGRQVASYLVQNTAKTYNLTKKQAELVVSMSSGASVAAAESATLNRASRKKTINTVMEYILAGLDSISSQKK